MNRALTTALSNPQQALSFLERIDCEESLLEFMKRGWHALEPGTPFLSSWAVEAICEHLEAVTKGQITRLLINVPPGCTKSMTVNVFWPAWEWGPRGRPDLRYISASYGQDLSIRDNMRCRDLIQSEWYQGHWPTFKFKSDQNAKIKYETDKAGWRLASSVGAQLVGHRGDRIIVDDPHATKEAESELIREDTRRWFGETVPTRLNKLAESAIIVIMQRLHTRDVSGMILDKAKELGYEHLCLPMWYESDHPHKSTRFKDPRAEGELLWPERFPEAELEKLKTQFRQAGGTYAEAGQLQQRPVPRGGGLFKEGWWRRCKVVPEGGVEVRGWDLAATEGGGKFTVGAKVKRVNGAYYITDIRRGQWGPNKVKTEMKRAAEDDGYGVDQDYPQDPGQAGKSQVLDFAQNLDGYSAWSSPESGDKETRALPLAAQCEAGNVYIPEGAPWADELIKEGSLFPVGEFTDQIDALSRAYARLLLKKEDVVPTTSGEVFE